MRNVAWQPILWTMLWIALIVVSEAFRPLMPVDETRYLTVAWEMWQRGDFLVPHLNGEPYSHKPPLLFWSMHLGWALFGVNEWWPQMVAPLFGLGSLFLTAALSRRLWPDRSDIALIAPLLLIGSAYWALFTTLTMFDMLVAACTLIALIGVVDAWRIGGRRAWLLVGLGIGLGILAKGPVILLQVLPVALLAPLWDAERRIKTRERGWGRWYRGILFSILIGALIGLAWAVPAAVFGGEAFREAIFWGQTAGRMVKSFAHQQPWWWFFALIGPLLLPWTIWPPLWRSFRRMGEMRRDSGIRFCLAWFLPVFLAFSAISGKQPHYLLPIFPAFALTLAALLMRPGAEHPRRWDEVLPGLLFAVLGAAVVLAPVLPIGKIPDWARELPAAWGVLLVIVGLAVAFTHTRDKGTAIASMSLLAVILVVTVHLIAAPRLIAAYDLRPVARALAGWEAQGYRIGHMGKYHGQFQFLGRLNSSIDVLEPSTLPDWLAANPKSKVVSYREEPDDVPAGADLVVPFRSDVMLIWDGSVLREDPIRANR
ncbi:MAG: glycosyltransferase family 39 protein [Rhodospirillales bacterium]|nr:glycosyltransferase family 39 protein [Rhodospirillales bacterium]